MAWIRRLTGWLVGWIRPRQEGIRPVNDVDLGPTIGVRVVAENRWFNRPRG